MSVLRIFSIMLSLLYVFGCDQATPPISKPHGPVWIIYNTSNSQLASDSVNVVIVHYDDTKWIGTDDGANSLNGAIWRTLKDSLYFNSPFGRSGKINAITIGRDKSVWFGFTGGGIMKLNLFGSVGSQWKRFQAPTISSDFVYSLAADNLGDIYVGTSRGVSRFIPEIANPDQGQWIKYGSGNSPIPDEPVRTVGLNLYDNLMWFGTSSQGIVSFDGDFNWNIDTPSERPFPILAMAFSKNEYAWFGTYADWAYRYSTKTFEWTHIADSANGGGLGGNYVNAVAVGTDGKVWFGSNNGLRYLNSTTWHTLNRGNSSLPSDTVTSLAFDFKGNLWIGTPHGLAEYNEEGTVQ